MTIGLNLEFARTGNLSFEESLGRASEMGYPLVEPYFYKSQELMINSHVSFCTHSSYCHLNADTMDIKSIQKILSKTGVSFSAINAHTSLLIPEFGIPHIKKAMDAAAEFGCGIVITDEGPVSDYWPSLDKAFEIFRISLEKILEYGRDKGIMLAIEPHNALTTREKYLSFLLRNYPSNLLGINFDTGNAFLSGNDPCGMLENLLERVVHIHAKDIPESLVHKMGTITGTRVGTAIGEGVVDFRKIMTLLKKHDYSGVLSVECDTPDQARKSFEFLRSLMEVE